MKYNEVYLDKKPEDYASWIRDPAVYGGEVEIVILASHFNVNITVVDCQVDSTSKKNSSFSQTSYLLVPFVLECRYVCVCDIDTYRLIIMCVSE